MKKIKIITVLFVILFSFSVNAQEKLEDKANAQVKEMKEKLSSANAQELTAEQEKGLTAIYLEKLKDIKKVKKEVADDTQQKEKIKELNKLYSKKIFDTVLTKEQKASLKAFNASKKEK
ncbi:hypothetical protein GFJ94_11375 [Flavobacterium sp. LMO8]|uniref:hypothetical protein n=1 Tax=Flavobacterium sp. LMO8 TaxID=2654244 RepID=UPI001291ADA6|nr:hypothetical protein [Flavobacterium sp. LMO8]MQP25663.1 hypothetical protein [Flavobacterium sp. LMO8]